MKGSPTEMGDNKRKYSAATAEIMKYINVENAKICASLMVLGFVVYHGLIHAMYGKFKQHRFRRYMSVVFSCHWCFRGIVFTSTF